MKHCTNSHTSIRYKHRFDSTILHLFFPFFFGLYPLHFNDLTFFSANGQTFHVLYHTDNNVLLGAPTGSGKTISAELAMLRLFNTQPDMKVCYSHILMVLHRRAIF